MASGRVDVTLVGVGRSETFNQTVTHGDQLRAEFDVGPWALQEVSPGDETLTTVSVPGRGFWILDETTEWCPSSDYTYDNSASNTGGVVPTGGLTIDGITVPAGAHVAQFRDFSGSVFSAQGQSGTYVFRGCRFRNNGIGQSSQFND